MKPQPIPVAGLSLASFIPRFLRRKKAGFYRQHERYNCVVIGTMNVVDIGATFEGAMTEISFGGCAFRPASMFMLDRIGEVVSVHTEYFTAQGRIRAVRPNNYGIQFFEHLDPELVSHINAEHGGNIAESYLAKRH